MYCSIRIKKKFADLIDGLVSINGLASAAAGLGLDLHHISPSLCKDPFPGSEIYKRVTIMAENRDYLRDLKKRMRREYGIKGDYTALVHALYKTLLEGRLIRILSFDVGFRDEKRTDLLKRLERIAVAIDKTCPDMIFIRELTPGSSNFYLSCLMSGLKVKYRPVLPERLLLRYDLPISLALVKACYPEETILLTETECVDQDRLFELFKLDNDIYFNVSIPSKSFRINDQMWRLIRNVMLRYRRKNQHFLMLAGLHDCCSVSSEKTYGANIGRLCRELHSTKINRDLNKGKINGECPNYVFANNFSVQHELIRTEVLKPSTLKAGITENEALLTEIRRPLSIGRDL